MTTQADRLRGIEAIAKRAPRPGDIVRRMDTPGMLLRVYRVLPGGDLHCESHPQPGWLGGPDFYTMNWTTELVEPADDACMLAVILYRFCQRWGK